MASFAGVGNPHARSELMPGETVLDLGSGAGLDSIIASWKVGPAGKVIGVDMNATMRARARAHAEAAGVTLECLDGRMEDIPLPDSSVDVIISNGVINLSFRKRRVIEEMYRTLKPGGRLEGAGFKRVRSAVVSGFKFRKGATQDAAESFGVKAVHLTAGKP